MKINLQNFKQHDDYSLELPDVGLVLLKGETGKGKTTIFEAVYDAITGDGEDVAPWSGGKPIRIDFEWSTIRIVRTHCPETLDVTIGGSIYKDDAAQCKIYEYFTAHTAEFTAAYYIRQRMEGSLLSMGATDMLRFIQMLAFGDQDPEVYRKRISDKIAALAQERSMAELELARNINNSNALCEKIQSKQSLLHPPEECAIDETNYLSFCKEHDKMTAQLQECRKSLNSINQLLQSPVHSARLKVASFEENLRAFTEGIQIIEDELKPITSVNVDFDDQRFHLTARENQLKKKLEFLRWKSSLDLYTNKLKSKFDDFRTPALAFLSEKKELFGSSHRQFGKQIDDKKRLLMEMTTKHDAQLCPECNNPLLVSDGKIIKAEYRKVFTTEEIQLVQKDIESIQASVDDYSRKYQDTIALLSEGQILKNGAIADPMPEVTTKEEAEKLIVEDNTLSTELTILARSVDSANREIESLHRKHITMSKELATMKENINDFKDIPNEEHLNTKKSAIQSTIDKLVDFIAATQSKIASYLAWSAERNIYDEKIKQINELSEELTKTKEIIVDSEKKVQLLSNRWAGAVRLKDLSDAAAIGATEGIVGAINSYSEEHIKQLFPHGGTSVRILSGTKTKKGDDLALSVIHKGQEVGKSIKPLSGGEVDRIKVAFQLALAEIYNARFMMLDEPFAGIDVDYTMELCFNLLKTFASDRLVFVAQHGAPEGVFDSVIELQGA